MKDKQKRDKKKYLNRDLHKRLKYINLVTDLKIVYEIKILGHRQRMRDKYIVRKYKDRNSIIHRFSISIS